MSKRRRSTSDLKDIAMKARRNNEVRFANDDLAERTPPRLKRFRADAGESSSHHPTPHPKVRFKSRTGLHRRRSFDARGTKRDRSWEEEPEPFLLPQEEMLVQYMEWGSEFDDDAMDIIEDKQLPEREYNEVGIRFNIADEMTDDNIHKTIGSTENEEFQVDDIPLG